MSDPLYISDAELAKRVLGRDASEWPVVLPTLEREGLPPRQAIMNNRRYLPAVLAFFEQRDGVKPEAENEDRIRHVPPPRERFGRLR